MQAYANLVDHLRVMSRLRCGNMLMQAGSVWAQCDTSELGTMWAHCKLLKCPTEWYVCHYYEATLTPPWPTNELKACVALRVGKGSCRSYSELSQRESPICLIFFSGTTSLSSERHSLGMQGAEPGAERDCKSSRSTASTWTELHLLV